MDHSVPTTPDDDERLWDELHHHHHNELIRHYSSQYSASASAKTGNCNNMHTTGTHTHNHATADTNGDVHSSHHHNHINANNINTNNNNHHHTAMNCNHTNRQPHTTTTTTSSSSFSFSKHHRTTLFQQFHDDIQRVYSIVSEAASDAYYSNHRHPYHHASQNDHHDDSNTNNVPWTTTTTAFRSHKTNTRSSFRWQFWRTNHTTSSTTHHSPYTDFAAFGIPHLNDADNDDETHSYQLYDTNNDSINNNNSNDRIEATRYIHLPTFDPRSFPAPENDGWASIGDLDVYFQSLYHYYYHRGWIPILTRGVTELMTITFTFLFSILVFVLIDWPRLSFCIDESSCQSDFIQHYIRRRPFQTNQFWTLYSVWIILYIVIFGIYCIVTFVSFLNTMQMAKRTKYIYEEKLGISARKLMNGAVDWDRDIVQKLIALQESGQYRIVIPNGTPNGTRTPSATIHEHTAQHQDHPTTNTADAPTTNTTNDETLKTAANDMTNGPDDDRPLSTAPPPPPYSATTTSTICHRQQQQQQHNISALMIANRILRKENFMIAFFNRQMLNLSIDPQSRHSAPRYFCSSLEWSIYYCVLNFIFNHKYQIRPAFYLDPAALRRRFQICGIMHVVFMPFLLFFATLYFGLRNVYDWKSTKQYLGPREWSISAKWMFREFNELPHIFERRLAPSYDAAETYVDLFGSNEFIAALGHICVFIGGSLGALVLAFAALNDAILLHVKIGDWNLLWYGGMFGILYSAGKSMIPKAIAQPKSARNLYAEMDASLAQVADHTHYYPEIWMNRGWDYATYSAFSSMFQYKVRLFLNEVISMILAPYILYVSLADCAESICDFVLSCRAEMPGVGDVCGFATFDFSAFQDEGSVTANAPSTLAAHTDEPIVAMGQSLSESILHTGNVEESIRQFPKPKARHGKMRHSFATFQDAHPSWSHVPERNNLLPTAGLVRRIKDRYLDLSNEQDLHRIAAARQLEVLERIEEGRSSEPEKNDDLLLLPNIIDDSYIPIIGATPSTN